MAKPQLEIKEYQGFSILRPLLVWNDVFEAVQCVHALGSMESDDNAESAIDEAQPTQEDKDDSENSQDDLDLSENTNDDDVADYKLKDNNYEQKLQKPSLSGSSLHITPKA